MPAYHASRSAANSIIKGRSVVANSLGIVASSHPLAARAGVQMLELGGHAVDAAIAAAAVVSVTEPASNGLGGDLFAIVDIAGSESPQGINASGWSPAGATPEFAARRGLARMPVRGPLSVTVPGVVAGWTALRDRYGRLPLATLLAPAIHYAERGFPVTEVVARLWSGRVNSLSANDEARKTFLPRGRPPLAGEIFSNPALARTLRELASGGRDAFYRGRAAEAIVHSLSQGGSTMALQDLAEYEPEWVTPICVPYRDWMVYELPPQGQGIAALMMLRLMERFPLSEWGLHSTRSLHVMVEAKKLAYADMLKYVGDTRFTGVPTSGLLDGDRAARRASLIRMDRANSNAPADSLPGVTDSSGGDTIYLSAIDRDGNIVSLIQSIYSEFGSGVVARETGVMLQNRGALFTLAAGHPNTLEPRKRPLHTIIPGFMRRGSERVGFGIMGGWNQAQAHAQFVAHVADFDLDIQSALEAGRFSKASFAGCDVNLEHLIPVRTRRELSALGHRVGLPRPRSGTFGWGQAVRADTAGVHYGASEPRHDGMAIPEAPVLSPHSAD